MSTISTKQPRVTRSSGRSKVFALIAAVAAVFLLGACHFLGSGTVVSANGRDNATFTFNVTCTAGHESGALTYVDNGRPYRVSVHATPTSASLRTGCTSSGFFTQNFNGTYVPLDPRITGGQFTLTVSEGGTAIGGPGEFTIAFTTGDYAGYSNSGPVHTGNIVVVN